MQILFLINAEFYSELMQNKFFINSSLILH